MSISPAPVAQKPVPAPLRCNLCNAACECRGSYRILGRHRADFWQCLECGYGFLNEPFWLPEAYASAITSVDIGPLNRCIETSRIVKVLIDLYHRKDGLGLDYGAGYGLFTRRMRDLGYLFLWHDTYCANLFAKGFEGQLTNGQRYEVITAFEVLEHLVAPKAELDRIISSCESFIFSTTLLPDPLPQFDQWWYYAPEHGQHVSFYSRSSLETLARKHGKHFATGGNGIHVITSKKINPRLFRWLARRKVSALYTALRPRPSLLGADFEAGRKRALASLVSVSKMDRP
jgi:Methyltransferase domain